MEECGRMQVGGVWKGAGVEVGKWMDTGVEVEVWKGQVWKREIGRREVWQGASVEGCRCGGESVEGCRWGYRRGVLQHGFMCTVETMKERVLLPDVEEHESRRPFDPGGI